MGNQDQGVTEPVMPDLARLAALGTPTLTRGAWPVLCEWADGDGMNRQTGSCAVVHIEETPLIDGVAMGIGAMSVVMLRLPLTSVLLASLLLASDGLAVMPLVIVAVVVAYVASARLTPTPATAAPSGKTSPPPETSPPTTEAPQPLNHPAPRSTEPYEPA